MRDSVRSASYSSVCNVLRQWNIQLIPTYRVYRLYDNNRSFLFCSRTFFPIIIIGIVHYQKIIDKQLIVLKINNFQHNYHYCIEF